MNPSLILKALGLPDDTDFDLAEESYAPFIETVEAAHCGGDAENVGRGQASRNHPPDVGGMQAERRRKGQCRSRRL